MPVTIFQVDAFADRPFAGNPAGVCVLPAWRADGWMQAVAAEMNVAETAFLVPRRDDFDLRWFTPAVEVDLCGHATLASAHALWETGRLAPSAAARFHTKSGLLTCTRVGDRIEMDFPAEPPAAADPHPDLLRSLAIEPRWVGRNRMDFFAELPDESAVRALAPDLTLLAQLPCRGVIVTARADAATGADFVSRFFAPQSGVPEDPVTGSAHCALGPFWQERLGKAELVGYQASRRGGFVHVRCAGERVILGGQAVTVLRAELVAGETG
jgi:PhzF family phenazine biosynthesis protein